MGEYVPLSVTIADNIKNMIFIEKKYQPGDKLPNERTLAAELKVGRNSLREALKLLVADNILIIKRSSGIFVSETPGISKDPYGLNYIENKEEILNQWLEVRLLIEPSAASFAATRANDEEIEEICYYAEKCAEILENGGSVVDAVEFDSKFHHALNKAAHNELIIKIMPIVNNYFLDSLQIAYARSHDERLINNMKFHTEIAKFIKLRDGNGAGLSMRMHILNAEELFRNKKSDME